MASENEGSTPKPKRVRRGTKKKPSAKRQVIVPEEEQEDSSYEPVRREGEGKAMFPTLFRIKRRHITEFLRQLIMLLEAGTPLLRALRTLAERGSNAALRDLVSDIASHVEAGNPLWQAFNRHPKYFDTVFVNLVKASEASGTLVTVLRRTVDYRERRESLVRRVRSSLIYPGIVVVVSLAVIIFLVTVVIPEFEALFNKLDIEVPQYTQNFLAVSYWITEWGWVILVALVVLFILYKLAVRNPVWRTWADRAKLYIPKFGGILRKFAVVEFTRSLALLLRSGVSMLVTLELVRNTVHNKAFAVDIDRVRDYVERGESIEEPLRQSKVIPGIVTDMLVTGEETGSLEQIADHVAESYEEEVDISINTLSELVVPVLTVIIGIIVVAVAFAVFVPMIDMVDQLSQRS